MITKKNSNRRVVDKLESLAGEQLTFGSLIKSIRLGEEMTQGSFARLLGISKQCLCDIEKGRRCVSPKLASKYAETLGYSKNQFIRLCLQDLLSRDGIHMVISIEAA